MWSAAVAVRLWRRPGAAAGPEIAVIVKRVASARQLWPGIGDSVHGFLADAAMALRFLSLATPLGRARLAVVLPSPAYRAIAGAFSEALAAVACRVSPGATAPCHVIVCIVFPLAGVTIE